MNKPVKISVEDLAKPLTYGVEAVISPEYAKAERDLLWPKVWQMAGRVEEIPEVGNFITYDILDDSIIIVRTATDAIKAYYNVCPHRGRQLVDTPGDQNRVCGKKKNFICGFHGWTFDLEGKNTYILDQDDWNGALDEERTSLSEVKVDSWGGWIFINMDLGCVPLLDYLGDVDRILGPFEFEEMRFKWRQWVVYSSYWDRQPIDAI